MKRSFLTVVLLLSLLVTACGEKAPSVEITIALLDFQFSPNEFIVPAGQAISFSGVNTGAVVHNFVIMKSGTSAGDSFDEEDMLNIFWEVELEPGADVETGFVAPSEPGEYQIICRTQGHIASGMIGKLIVVADE